MPHAELFQIPISEVFALARRRVRDGVEAIPCDKIAEGERLARQILNENVLKLPEFGAEAVSARLDDNGEYATYTHTISNAEAFNWCPSSSTLISQSYEIQLLSQQTNIRFLASTDSTVTKAKHQSVARIISQNVEQLRREIENFNPTLDGIASAALNKRKAFCEDLERRRKELL